MDEHKLLLRPPVWLPVLIALILGVSYLSGQYVRTQDNSRPTVSVQGEGKVSAVPDIAVLNFGVQTGRQRSAQQAMQVLADRMGSITAAVKELGIEDKDIMTQNLSMNPSYDYVEGRRIEGGFEANQNLQVKVRDLSQLTAVLDAAVQQGANQVGGVSFTIDDPKELREEARKEAIANAQAKAASLAADLGMTLGKIKGFHEGGGMEPPMPYARMEMMDAVGMGGGGAPPVPSGEQEIRVNVSLTYELR